jgi:uncharacterized LabA/DUF88 family protein
LARVAVFVDGFNVYHALERNPEFRKYKWLDYAVLARCYLRGGDTPEKVYLFTTLATWEPSEVARHHVYLHLLRRQGVEVVLGKFKMRDRRCLLCHQSYRSPEEKLTDVNIAVHLLRGAFLDEYDRAVLVKGDTDLLPAIQAVQQTFPAKEVGVVIPIGNRSNDLIAQCNFRLRMKEEQLSCSQFPDEVDGPVLGKLRRPETWR